MTRKKTHAEYTQELLDREIDLWPLEEYVGAKVSINHECVEGHINKISPTQVLGGSSCPQCAGNRQKTHEEYIQSLLVEGIDFRPLEPYKGAHIPTLHICSKGHEWKAMPNNIIKRRTCSKCMPSKGLYSESYFEKHPEEGDKLGVLYCVVLVDKSTMNRECIKIGITKGTSYRDVSKRAVGFKGYETRVQKIVKGRLEDIFYLEQYLHEKWQDKKYTSAWKFGGHTELFQMDNEIIRSIPDKV